MFVEIDPTNKKYPLKKIKHKKTGDDLISRKSSTIGTEAFNYCVRNGNRLDRHVIIAGWIERTRNKREL